MLGHHQFTRSIIQSVAVEASGRVDTTLLFGEVENHEKIASRAKEEYADSVQSGTSSQIEKPMWKVAEWGTDYSEGSQLGRTRNEN